MFWHFLSICAIFTFFIPEYSFYFSPQTPIYDSQITGRLGQPGVAVGLAWTTAGGEIMYVEATKMDGDGQLILTGQLGKVMKESAQLALNLVRTHMHEVQYNLKSMLYLLNMIFYNTSISANL